MEFVIICAGCGSKSLLSELTMLDGWTEVLDEDIPVGSSLRESTFKCKGCGLDCKIQRMEAYSAIAPEVPEEVPEDVPEDVLRLIKDKRLEDSGDLGGQEDQIKDSDFIVDDDSDDSEVTGNSGGGPAIPLTVDENAELDAGGNLETMESIGTDNPEPTKE